MKYRTIETQIPWKYKWKAIDADGIIAVFTDKPRLLDFGKRWDTEIGDFIEIGRGPKPKDWTKTLVKL